MFKEVDSTKSPDGACWTVVQTRDGAEVPRARFGDEATAYEYARVMVGGGYLVHIEGPENAPIQAIDS